MPKMPEEKSIICFNKKIMLMWAGEMKYEPVNERNYQSNNYQFLPKMD